MQYQPLNKEQGITLVALIITIVVLIILVAVSIRALINAKMLNLVTQSTIDYTEAQTNELNKAKELDGYLKNLIEKLNEQCQS